MRNLAALQAGAQRAHDLIFGKSAGAPVTAGPDSLMPGISGMLPREAEKRPARNLHDSDGGVKGASAPGTNAAVTPGAAPPVMPLVSPAPMAPRQKTDSGQMGARK